MATAQANQKVFVSPGVYTSETDLSFVAQSVGVTTLGLVGETIKGPAFEPVFITNYDEFQAYFGEQNPLSFTILKYQNMKRLTLLNHIYNNLTNCLLPEF